MLKIFFLSFIIMACGPKKEPKADVTKPTCEEQIKAKATFYLDHANLDSFGWVKDTKCDGLLFNSLYSISGGKPNILLAQDGDVWLRHPAKDCYPGGSGSSISRDMFMGLFLWIWHNKRLDVVQSIIDYGENHNWVMGEGDSFAIGIRPQLQATVYELRYRLGGADHGKRQIPQIRFELTGYQDHLQMLDILLRALVVGGISDMDLKAAKSSSEREPNNALFSAIYHRYADGDFTQAIKVLLDERLFPVGRMPSSGDRCEMYLWQRDESADWQPCKDSGKIFSGIDFLFAKAVILNEI